MRYLRRTTTASRRHPTKNKQHNFEELAPYSCHTVPNIKSAWGCAVEGFYSQVVDAGFFGVQLKVVLLGFLILFIGLFRHSKVFERLVDSRIGRHLHLAYAAYGLPLVIVLMEIQRTRRGGGGIFRFLGIFLLVVIMVIFGILGLIAFLIYRFLRRRG